MVERERFTCAGSGIVESVKGWTRRSWLLLVGGMGGCGEVR